MSFGIDPSSPHEYVDETERPEFILKMEEDVLYRWLGKRAFLIERDGYYDPRIIIKMDFFERGKKNFQKYVKLVKSKICPRWEHMKKSGLFKDMEAVYLTVLGVLIGQDVPRALAVVIAAIIARRGLDNICRS
ncbi:MAG: hypothetical protein OEW62_01240 [Candidatus Bathyarchaeota archaeon]|nr:hypothetical protein [Candidatus Bathyarchaeota archaeon]MDH5595208.1 hypothetical protein [Candidatus Bathyarchaeota archaeon]